MSSKSSGNDDDGDDENIKKINLKQSKKDLKHNNVGAPDEKSNEAPDDKNNAPEEKNDTPYEIYNNDDHKSKVTPKQTAPEQEASSTPSETNITNKTGNSNNNSDGKKNGNGLRNKLLGGGRISPPKRAGLTKFNPSTSGMISKHKNQIPLEFPNLLSIPLTRRPLFPGYYKSMYIKDPKVIAAIQELVKSGTPYVGIFMAKDENADDDMVSNINQVEKVQSKSLSIYNWIGWSLCTDNKCFLIRY